MHGAHINHSSARPRQLGRVDWPFGSAVRDVETTVLQDADTRAVTWANEVPAPYMRMYLGVGGR
jgi:hypothetical protein